MNNLLPSPPGRVTRRRLPLLASILVAGMLGCKGEPTASTPRAPMPGPTSAQLSRTTASLGAGPVSEIDAFRAMTTLTRLTAMALANDSVRQAVYQAIQDSKVKEHKIHFATYLDQAGSPLIAELARRLGSDVPRIRAIRDTAVDLELYVPVKEHFGRWTGDANILVATSFDIDTDIPIAYDLQGNRVTLTSAETPPGIPVIALVRAETRFPRSSFIMLSECDPTAVDCSEDTGGGSNPPPAPLPGINLEFSFIADDHEGFLGGDPEYEIFPAFALTPGADTMSFNQCVGAHAGDQGRGGPGIKSTDYFWDQNSQTWNSRTLILSQAQIDAAAVPDSAVMYWVFEDDNEACVIRLLGSGDPGDFMTQVAQQTAGGRIHWRNRFAPLDPISLAVNLVRDMVSALTSSSKDDQVGILVNPSDVGQGYMDANFAIVNGQGGIEGRMKIVKH